jgi:hypothetical protein
VHHSRDFSNCFPPHLAWEGTVNPYRLDLFQEKRSISDFIKKYFVTISAIIWGISSPVDNDD